MKTLQAASPGQDLHISCFCFDNIGLYFYVLLRGSPTHPIYDRCGNSTTQSQAPDDGYINVRNTLNNKK